MSLGWPTSSVGKRRDTNVEDKRLGLLGNHQLFLGLRVETMLTGDVTHDWQVLSHLDRLAVMLIDDVG